MALLFHSLFYEKCEWLVKEKVCKENDGQKTSRMPASRNHVLSLLLVIIETRPYAARVCKNGLKMYVIYYRVSSSSSVHLSQWFTDGHTCFLDTSKEWGCGVENERGEGLGSKSLVLVLHRILCAFFVECFLISRIHR